MLCHFMYLPVQKTTQFSASLYIFSKCKNNYDGVDKYYFVTFFMGHFLFGIYISRNS